MISTRRDNILNVHDVDIEFGAQYHSKLKNKYDVVIGATYHPEANLRTKQNTMVRSYKGSVGSIDLIIDTVDQVVNDKGNIVFPETIGFGASIGQGHKWMFGIDYKFEEWENFTSYNIYDSLTNRHSIRFGGHIIPNAVSSSYLNRIDFRAGFRYDISYLYLRNEQLNGFGITFGLGIPVKSNAIRGTRSMINVGFEMGRLGTTSYGLIQENYYNFYLSVSIFERWFVKRRYR
jgi:long-subunit fatty acid transport protein